MKMCTNLNIRAKILILPAMFVLGILLLQLIGYRMDQKLNQEIVFPNFEKQVLRSSELTLQSVVNVQALSVADRLAGEKSQEELIAILADELDGLRFFDDGSGYFFVFDTLGNCMAQPINKKLVGTNTLDLKDPDGVFFIQELIKVAQEGGGFVPYRFEKAGSGVTPKISYAKMIPGTDYLIGSGVYVDNVQAEKEALSAKIGKEQRAYNMINLVVFMAILLPMIALSFCISGVIAKPLVKATALIKEVAKGDLRVRLGIKSRDEVGQMACSFDAFVENMQRIIGEMANTAQEVASAATQVAASAEEMSSGISLQVDQATQVSAAVEQMTATIIEVARKAADASSHSDHAGKYAQEGLTVVEKTIEGMNNIAKVVGESSLSIDELGKRGVQIGEIISVINDIADQTNLLALNAAIEAARAGEHGRGFAVVADEVRKLADRTTSATDEVAQAIKAIQSETNTAVEKMGAGTQRVSEGVALARESGSSLSSIVDGTSQVALMIQSIAAAAEEQSATSEQIARNIDGITAVTRQSSEGAEQASAAAAQLSRKSDTLQQIVSQFKY